MRIRRLPESVINRIAAGEVVERPAAAVKELVENSLDAGARRIDIVVEEGGLSLLGVTDDGCGMTSEELAVAVERHATSKLADDDLTRITTLGFRGEALPSIGAVSRMTVVSRTRDADSAWLIAVDGGQVRPCRPAAHPPGTRIEVRDLFFATPARLKFLKKPATELSHVVDAVNRLAMARPATGFTLVDHERTLLSVPPAPAPDDAMLLQRLRAIVGRDFAECSTPVRAERDEIVLSGFAGLPTLHRRTAAQQFLFVNGRPVRDRLLHGAVRAAYFDVLPSDRYPAVALFLTLPTEFVDVNVHPMKTEVRFRDSGFIRGVIVGALKHALAAAGHRAAPPTSGPTWRRAGAGKSSSATNLSLPLRAATVFGLADQEAAFFDALSAEACQASPVTPLPESGASDHAAVPPLGFARTQVLETFIIAQNADGLVIVDQHAAHERIVHERLKRALDGPNVARQALLIPEVVELEPEASRRLVDRAGELADLGLVVEGFGGSAVVVREVPAVLGNCDVPGLIRDLADDLAELGEAVALRERLSHVCGTMACHGSVRAGRKLSIEEMNELLRAMESTPHSGQCSHGRPTYIELKRVAIEKLFGRR